jgi:hypothetical protein
VVDPIRQTRGFFQWREGTMAQVGGYTLTADRGDRIALARLVNDLENIPNTESGGGGLSPRLEAELLAMLTRPAPPHVSGADRTLTATVFAMLGLLAGVLIVLATVGLNQVFKTFQDQSAKVDSLAESVDRSSAAQRLALETLLSSAASKEHDPDAFLAQYNKTVHNLDVAYTKLEHQVTINDTLAAKAKALENSGDKLRTELALANGAAQKYEKDAKEAPKLRERVDTLETENLRQGRKLAEQEDLLDQPAGKKVVELARRHDRVWYIAVAGWGLALMLGLGLVAVFGLKPLPEAETTPAPPAPRPDVEGTPPHHIT